MNVWVEFAKARLTDDEQVALAASEVGGPDWPTGQNDQVGPSLAHARRHDPARVLREVEANRQILAEHPATTGWDGDGSDRPICLTCSTADQSGGLDGDPYPCRTLRALASIWSDHEFYPGK